MGLFQHSLHDFPSMTDNLSVTAESVLINFSIDTFVRSVQNEIMNIDIAKPSCISEIETKHFYEIIAKCNSNDGTSYTFDPKDDYKKDDEINHFILYSEGIPVSAVYLFAPGSSEAEVYGFTLPSYRGRGFMRTLLEEVTAEIRSRSIPSLLLVCDGNSESGKRFVEMRNADYDFSEYSMIWKQSPVSVSDFSVELRSVSGKDRDRLAEINSEAFDEEKSEAEKFIDLFISSDLRDFYSVVHEGEIVGMIGRYLEDARDYIHGFCIAAPYRGKGLGRQALLQMVDICRKADPARQIMLEVETENENALKLYKSCGFRLESVFAYYREKI